MVCQPLRIATTAQLARSVREGGFEAFVLPNSDELDFNRSLQLRLADGNSHRQFLEDNRIDLVLDYNTAALTFVPNQAGDGVREWSFSCVA